MVNKCLHEGRYTLLSVYTSSAWSNRPGNAFLFPIAEVIVAGFSFLLDYDTTSILRREVGLYVTV